MSRAGETKTCTRCGRELPATAEYFAPKRCQCRECRATYYRVWYAANEEKRALSRDAWKDANRERHLQSMRNWCREHEKERAEYSRAYREANREEEAARRRAWYEANKAKVIAKVAAWQKEHPEAYAAAQKRSRSAHPDTRRARGARARARRYGLKGALRATDIQEQYAIQEGRCFYCGADLPDDYHVDHYVPLSRGGADERSNIRLACPCCNRSKGCKSPEQFAAAR